MGKRQRPERDKSSLSHTHDPFRSARVFVNRPKIYFMFDFDQLIESGMSNLRHCARGRVILAIVNVSQLFTRRSPNITAGPPL